MAAEKATERASEVAVTSAEVAMTSAESMYTKHLSHNPQRNLILGHVNCGGLTGFSEESRAS